jgi:hypothetical protein
MNSIPYRNQQDVNLRYAMSLEGVEDILQGYTKMRKESRGDYYLHIDQFQVFSPTENGKYPVLVLFHRMSLYKDGA